MHENTCNNFHAGSRNQPMGLNSEVSAAVSDAGDPGEGVMEVNSIR